MKKIKKQGITRRLKKNSSNLSKKIELRQKAIKLSGKEFPWILDCYCGDGRLWSQAYNKTRNYQGIDQKIPNNKEMPSPIVGNNLDILKQIDLERYDIIDLDAYGGPLRQYGLICERIKTNKIIVITDGIGRDLRCRGQSSVKRYYLAGMEIPEDNKIHFKMTPRVSMACYKNIAFDNGLEFKKIEHWAVPVATYMQYILGTLTVTK